MKWYGNDGRANPLPGVSESLRCDVCQAEMAVERNVHGPTGSAEAMSGRGHLHDAFTCPNLHTGWHYRIIVLRSEGIATKSQRIRALLAEEIGEILRTR